VLSPPDANRLQLKSFAIFELVQQEHHPWPPAFFDMRQIFSLAAIPSHAPKDAFNLLP
jgi:hypothetical protein